MDARPKATVTQLCKAALSLTILLVTALLVAKDVNSAIIVNEASVWGEGSYQRSTTSGYEFHFNHNPIDSAGAIDTGSWYDPFGGSANDRFHTTRIRHGSSGGQQTIDRYQSWGSITCTYVSRNRALIEGAVESTDDPYLKPTNVNSEEVGTPTRRRYVKIYVFDGVPDKAWVYQTSFIKPCGKNRSVRRSSVKPLQAGYVEIEKDGDKDGKVDRIDNCPVDKNASQKDFDSDRIGDACDRNTVGTSGRDYFHGNRYDEVIKGQGSEDSLAGSGGKDEIHGGLGNDYIFGRKGDDKLYGQSGKDVIEGGRGKDLIKGGNGNDLINGGFGRDRLYGGKGRDKIRSLDGKRDYINCGGGRDTLVRDSHDKWKNCERVF